MRLLDALTDDGVQSLIFSLADGSTVNLKFIYRPATQRWTIDVSYKTFVANGLGLSISPNLLRLWRNIIPFGMTVASADAAEPFKLDDFTSGRITIYMLDDTNGGTDVQTMETLYFTP